MSNVILWTIGGFLAAAGIATAAYGGFGLPNGDTSQVFATVGYDAIDDIVIHGQGWAAIGLFLSGCAVLISANRNAWKETGGY